jgi:anti-sigma B factor antagonist
MPDQVRPFEVRSDAREGGAVVIASGEIDLWSAPAVRDALSAHAGVLVLDLRAVTFMDSSGLGLIVEQQQRARRMGGRFAVAVARTSDPHRILEMSGLTKVLECVDDPDAVLTA